MISKKTGIQAYANMKALMIKHVSGVKGYCHRTCQNAWKLPIKYNSALDAWNNTPKNHRHSDPRLAPIGVPHYWSAPGDKYGHVALQSDKKGIVISSDAPISDYVGEVPLTWFKTHWGKTYLGWGSMYNDVILDANEMPK